MYICWNTLTPGHAELWFCVCSTPWHRQSARKSNVSRAQKKSRSSSRQDIWAGIHEPNNHTWKQKLSASGFHQLISSYRSEQTELLLVHRGDGDELLSMHERTWAITQKCSRAEFSAVSPAGIARVQLTQLMLFAKWMWNERINISAKRLCFCFLAPWRCKIRVSDMKSTRYIRGIIASMVKCSKSWCWIHLTAQMLKLIGFLGRKSKFEMK